jgi:hypothetical protein
MRYAIELATQVCNDSYRYPFLYIAGIHLTGTLNSGVAIAQHDKRDYEADGGGAHDLY